MTTRSNKELTEARRLVNRLHRCQKRLKLPNRDFVDLCNQHGGELVHRTYPNWLTAHGNLPRRSAFPGIKQILSALDPQQIPAEPAQVTPPVVPPPDINATPIPVETQKPT